MLDPNYVEHLPSRQMLSEKLVPELYDQLRSDILTCLAESACYALSVELFTTR